MVSIIKQKLIKFLIRAGIICYLFLLKLPRMLGIIKPSKEIMNGVVLMTGTFYSNNWIITHLRPLALSEQCSKVFMVTENILPEIEKVQPIYPPTILKRVFGGDIARILTFCWLAAIHKPDFIGGFHLLVNGLIAALTAQWLGKRSIYICGGGPREVLGGGYKTDNKIFKQLQKYDSVIEKKLLEAAGYFDVIVVMGNSARNFFVDNGVVANFAILPGGFDGRKFFPATSSKEFDLIMVGRLSPIKRVDRLVEALVQIKTVLPDITATIVGDGPSRAALENYAKKLGVEGNLKFVGHQDNVEYWLKQSKIFLLTSDAEGVSQAMIEAMLSGNPVVVPDVGDLKDLVRDGVNGYLVKSNTAEEFAVKIGQLIQDKDLRIRLGKSARKDALRYDVKKASELWDHLLWGAFQKSRSNLVSNIRRKY